MSEHKVTLFTLADYLNGVEATPITLTGPGGEVLGTISVYLDNGDGTDEDGEKAPGGRRFLCVDVKPADGLNVAV